MSREVSAVCPRPLCQGVDFLVFDERAAVVLLMMEQNEIVCCGINTCIPFNTLHRRCYSSIRPWPAPGFLLNFFSVSLSNVALDTIA